MRLWLGQDLPRAGRDRQLLSRVLLSPLPELGLEPRRVQRRKVKAGRSREQRRAEVGCQGASAQSTRGTGKAIIALARKFLGIIYNTLKNNWVFADFPDFVLAEEKPNG